jgi:hypothetical protein
MVYELNALGVILFYLYEFSQGKPLQSKGARYLSAADEQNGIFRKD